jgi:hypothetical protein
MRGRVGFMRKSGAATTKADPERVPARPASDEEASARAARRDALLRFLADPPRNVADAALALREAEKQYGDETDRELADLEAGQHPLQRPKAEFSTG